jgi:hypothetical protein
MTIKLSYSMYTIKTQYYKLRVKSLLLKYSHKESRKRKHERATVLNRYRRIVCKTNLSEDEVKELDLVKSQLETMV